MSTSQNCSSHPNSLMPSYWMKSDVPTNFFKEYRKNYAEQTFLGLLFYAIQQQRNEMAISVFLPTWQ